MYVCITLFIVTHILLHIVVIAGCLTGRTIVDCVGRRNVKEHFFCFLLLPLRNVISHVLIAMLVYHQMYCFVLDIGQV